MEQQITITPEYIRQLVYSILPEVLAQYKEEKGKDISLNPLLERLIRLEEELKALRIEMNIRFEAIIQEINIRFEAQRKESDARFEAINSRFEAINSRFEAVLAEQRALREEINARFEAVNARFEALEKRLNFLQWLIAIGFSFLIGLMTFFNFFRFFK
jgi:tetrahydromethanopterin S-methyltransferase subunit G